MDLRELISNQNDVSLILAKEVISSEAKESNCVFSPLSLHVALGLIAARSKGPTQDQLLSFQKSKSSDDLNSLIYELISTVVAFPDGSTSGGPRLSFANGVWVDQSLRLKPSYKEIVDGVYKAVSNQVDFQNKPDEVVNEVNSWAEKETSGLIKEILSPDSVDNTTMLVFANALYFKGAWLKKCFDESKTKDHDFHLLNGSSIKVPLMTSMNKQYISAYDDFKVLCLRYKQGEDERQFSMYLFLPNAQNGLPALLDKVSSEPGFLDNHLPDSEVEVIYFLIPKFKISFGFEASEVIKRLGLVLPFSSGGGGGLSEMVDSPVSENLYVSKIFQKSIVEVNEEGTEAAAVTAAKARYLCLNIYDEYFVADHPFLFVIREDISGVVLFIGTVVNPLVS